MYSGSKKSKSILVLISMLATSSVVSLFSFAAGPSESHQETMALGCSQAYDVDIEQKKIDDERTVINEEQRQLYIAQSELQRKENELIDKETKVNYTKTKKSPFFNEQNEVSRELLKNQISEEQRNLEECSALQKAKQAKVSIQLLAIDLRQIKINLLKSLPPLSNTQFENEFDEIYTIDSVMSIMPLISNVDMTIVGAKKDMEVSIKHLLELYFRNVKSAAIREENGKSSTHYRKNAIRILSSIRDIQGEYYLEALEAGKIISSTQRDISDMISASDKNRSLENEVQKLIDRAKEKIHMSQTKLRDEASAEMYSIDPEN